MAARNIKIEGLGDWAAQESARAKIAHDAKHAPGPDLTAMACACGRFGPWGEGEARYCAEHVPAHLRYAAQFFAETMG